MLMRFEKLSLMLAITLLSIPSGAHSQTPVVPPPQVKVGERDEQEPRIPTLGPLSILIRADPDADAFELGDKINKFAIPKVFEGLTGRNEAEAKVNEVDESVFLALEALISKGKIPDVAIGGIQIREFKNADKDKKGSKDWKIETGDPDVRLEGLTLKSKDSAKGESTSEFIVEPKTKSEAPLRFEGLGTYRLRLDAGVRPVRCELRLKRDNEAESFTRSVDWPRTDKFFLVVINGYPHDPERLLEQFKKPEVVGSRFKVLSNVAPIRLSLTDMRLVPPRVYSGWINGVTFRMGIPMPDNAAPERAWVLFPLTGEQRNAKSAEIRELLSKQNYTALPPYIDKGAVIWAPETPLSPDLTPSWYELAKKTGTDGNGFTREFQLTNVEGWKSRDEMKECWGLVVYEYGQGELRRPIKVEHPETKEIVYVVDRLFPEFISGLPRKSANSPAAKPVDNVKKAGGTPR